ncbi:MAG: hypothetical protein ACFFC7_01330 [Candidatus Hermodarchaeota archaeon]
MGNKSRGSLRIFFRVSITIFKKTAEECLFINDQPINVETAQNLDMHALHYLEASHLTRWLQQYGILVSQDPKAEKQTGAGFRGDNLSPWTDNNISKE